MEKVICYTFIIPHKNCPELLQRCVDSIPIRDDVQVIVVDDNSDADKKPQIEREGVEIVLLDAEHSKGAGRARNVGLEQAKGKWLLFADSDDYFADHFYEIITRYKNHQADMILFKVDSVDSETLKPSNRHVGVNSAIDRCLRGDISERQVSFSRESPWSRMIRRSLVSENNICFDEVLASNDTMFTTKVSHFAKKIEVSNNVLYVVTHRQGSLWNSRKSPENYLTRVSVAIAKQKFLKEQGYPPSPLIRFFVKMGYVNFKTNVKALKMMYSSNTLLPGISHIIKRKLKNFFI